MTTKSVGIRELKEQAPNLVQRAENGERTVITRHGRPIAVLAPVTDAESIDAERPRVRAWQRERERFERLLPELGRRYRGRVVAVLGGKVIDSDLDAAKLFHVDIEVAGRRSKHVEALSTRRPYAIIGRKILRLDGPKSMLTVTAPMPSKRRRG